MPEIGGEDAPGNPVRKTGALELVARSVEKVVVALVSVGVVTVPVVVVTVLVVTVLVVVVSVVVVLVVSVLVVSVLVVIVVVCVRVVHCGENTSARVHTNVLHRPGTHRIEKYVVGDVQ